MAFKGWSVEAVEFYEGLAANNSKVYWQDHKAVYESTVKGPMEELLAELAPEFGEGRVMRPYRDLRFSKDKQPYKLSCGAHVGTGFISLSAEGLFMGSGLYMPEAPRLARYREAVADDQAGPELQRIILALDRGGYEAGAHESLKTAPKTYPKDHPRIELLRWKGPVMSKTWPVGAWLGTRKAKDHIVKGLMAARPLQEWLARHVG